MIIPVIIIPLQIPQCTWFTKIPNEGYYFACAILEIACTFQGRIYYKLLYQYVALLTTGHEHLQTVN